MTVKPAPRGPHRPQAIAGAAAAAAAVIGAVAGLYPARRAARLPATEALASY